MPLEELYARYGEKLYHYLVIRLGSCQDAEDVLQELFYRFSRYSVRWKMVKNQKAFVFKAARNEANRFLKQKISKKKAIRMNANYIDAIASVIQGPDEKAEKILAVALGKLPDEQREIVTLKVFQEMTFREIARICGLSINTAASRYQYGLAKLRLFLEGKDGRGKK